MYECSTLSASNYKDLWISSPSGCDGLMLMQWGKCAGKQIPAYQLNYRTRPGRFRVGKPVVAGQVSAKDSSMPAIHSALHCGVCGSAQRAAWRRARRVLGRAAARQPQAGARSLALPPSLSSLWRAQQHDWCVNMEIQTTDRHDTFVLCGANDCFDADA